MEIVVNITDKDYLEFLKLHRHILFPRMSKIMPRLILGLSIVAAILLAILIFLYLILERQAELFELLVTTIFPLILLIGLVAFMPKLIYGKLAKDMKKRGGDGVLGEHTISLDAEQIKVSSPYSEGNRKWVGIDRIFENDQYIIVMYTVQLGLIIPKRDFVSAVAASQFADQARRYLDTAKSSMVN
jgi:hypothetical protein